MSFSAFLNPSQSLCLFLSTTSFVTHESPWWLSLPVSPPSIPLILLSTSLPLSTLISPHLVPNSAPRLSSLPYLTFLPLISASSLLAPLVTPIALSAPLFYPFLSSPVSLPLLSSSAWPDTAFLKHHDTSLAVLSVCLSSPLLSSTLTPTNKKVGSQKILVICLKGYQRCGLISG